MFVKSGLVKLASLTRRAAMIGPGQIAIAVRSTAATPLLRLSTRQSCEYTERRALSQPRAAAAHPAFRACHKPWGATGAELRRGRTRCNSASSKEVEVEVGMLVEANPLKGNRALVEEVQRQLEKDAEALMCHVVQGGSLSEEQRQMLQVQHGAGSDGGSGTKTVELSLVLCDDMYIRYMNNMHRGVDTSTDVLSFEMGEDDMPQGLPIWLLGDVIISLDTAERQAARQGHSLLEEARILLVHGVLHLLGFDHEQGDDRQERMAAEEERVLSALGWKGRGLVAVADGGARQLPWKLREAGGVKLVAIDMDGTLLNSSSRILPSSVDAIRAVLDHGTTVMVATGKARPAAAAAAAKAGLAGDGLLVSTTGPGLFLQGIQVHGMDGQPLSRLPQLAPDVVRAAFQYSLDESVPLCAFLGDECVTLRMTEELQELHETYYEPLAREVADISTIVDGPPVRKLLFMTDAATISAKVKPHWAEAAESLGADAMQAVPTMLELVPPGVNKWLGLQLLLQQTQLPASSVMAIGDGRNDLAMVQHAGIGVAMANAVPEVREAASIVVASNDEDGVAEALERFVL